MHKPVAAAHDLVSRIPAADDRARRDGADTLAWLDSTDDVFRRIKPDIPPDQSGEFR